MTIIERIDSLLTERGMKKKTVCELLSVSPSTYSTWVAMNTTTIPSEYIPKLANLFGITCDELLTGETQIISDDSTKHLIEIFKSLSWDGKQIIRAKAVEENRFEASA